METIDTNFIYLRFLFKTNKIKYVRTSSSKNDKGQNLET